MTRRARGDCRVGAARAGRRRALQWAAGASVLVPAAGLAGRLIAAVGHTALVEVPPRAASAPPLALDDLDGRRHTLDDHRGRVVVLNFWATWCAPCVAEMPSLQLMRERLGAGSVEVLGVNYGEAPQRVRAFAQRMDVDYPILLDAFHFARRDWRVTALPATWIIDRQGRLRYRAVGEVDWLDAAVLARIGLLIGANASHPPPTTASTSPTQSSEAYGKTFTSTVATGGSAGPLGVVPIGGSASAAAGDTQTCMARDQA